VTIDELRKCRDRLPFRPFAIRLADRREITIEHPENVAMDAKSRTAVCRSGIGWDVLDLDLVTSLGWPLPERRKGAK
jgi:hypothetical protein